MLNGKDFPVNTNHCSSYMAWILIYIYFTKCKFYLYCVCEIQHKCVTVRSLIQCPIRFSKARSNWCYYEYRNRCEYSLCTCISEFSAPIWTTIALGFPGSWLNVSVKVHRFHTNQSNYHKSNVYTLLSMFSCVAHRKKCGKYKCTVINVLLDKSYMKLS